MEGILIIFLLGWSGTLLIHWIALIPGNWLWGFVGQLLGALVPIFRLILAYGSAFMAGSLIQPEGKSLADLKNKAKLIAASTFLVTFIFYVHGYSHFKPEMSEVLVKEGVAPTTQEAGRLVDSYLKSKTGIGGAAGYFLILPQNKATLGDLIIPASTAATVFNWLGRLLMLGLLALASRGGAIGGISEKMKSIKESRPVSYSNISQYLDKMLDSLG